MAENELRHLGKVSQEPIEWPETVEVGGGIVPEQVTLHCTEFTSLCPVTKMPDYAEITIKYSPKHKLIETKSLKLYLLKFRTVAMFNELIVSLIAREINCVVDPISMTVIGEFAVRGGIKVTATEHIGND